MLDEFSDAYNFFPTSSLALMSDSIKSEGKNVSSDDSNGQVNVERAISLDDTHLNHGGAAVEDVSPLGATNFGCFSVICLNISQMVCSFPCKQTLRLTRARLEQEYVE